MKITSVKPLQSDKNVFVKITTDEGIFGIGDGTLHTRAKGVGAVLTDLEPVLVGKDPMQTERLWQEIYRGTFWRGGPILMAALSAVDIALWDIKGKAFNTPVYNLLGGPSREKIRMYTHCNGKTPEELCRNAEALLKEGYTCLRICPYDNLKDGFFEPGIQVRKVAAYMKALRDCVGEDVEIILECHTRLTPSWAIKLCESVAPYHPLFVEDALRADSPESYRVLRAHTNLALGTGEKFGAPWDYKTVFEEDLIDYCRTDICNGGGITSFMKIAHYAESHYIEMVPHGLPSPIGQMAALHCDLAVTNFALQERGLHRPDIPFIQADMTFKDGFIYLGSEPGIGIHLDEKALDPIRHYEHPHWVREDGSVQDW